MIIAQSQKLGLAYGKICSVHKTHVSIANGKSVFGQLRHILQKCNLDRLSLQYWGEKVITHCHNW